MEYSEEGCIAKDGGVPILSFLALAIHASQYFSMSLTRQYFSMSLMRGQLPVDCGRFGGIPFRKENCKSHPGYCPPPTDPQK